MKTVNVHLYPVWHQRHAYKKKPLSLAERSCRKSPLSHTRSEKVISFALLKCINACEAAKGMSHYPNEIPQDSCHCYCDQNVDKPRLSQCIKNCNSVMDVASRHRHGIFCQHASFFTTGFTRNAGIFICYLFLGGLYFACLQQADR